MVQGNYGAGKRHDSFYDFSYEGIHGLFRLFGHKDATEIIYNEIKWSQVQN